MSQISEWNAHLTQVMSHTLDIASFNGLSNGTRSKVAEIIPYVSSNIDLAIWKVSIAS
jgi:hypothetical protein